MDPEMYAPLTVPYEIGVRQPEVPGPIQHAQEISGKFIRKNLNKEVLEIAQKRAQDGVVKIGEYDQFLIEARERLKKQLLVDNLIKLSNCSRLAKYFINRNPEILGSLVATGIGFMAMVSVNDMPPEVRMIVETLPKGALADLSIALGTGSMAHAKTRGRSRAVRTAATIGGALSGMASIKGINTGLSVLASMNLNQEAVSAFGGWTDEAVFGSIGLYQLLKDREKLSKKAEKVKSVGRIFKGSSKKRSRIQPT